MQSVPQCDFAFIGGSSTLSVKIPDDLSLDYLKLEDEGLIFETPYGQSPPFQLLNIESDGTSRRIIHCKMHGWRSAVSRADASRQIFWVFREAGVKRILVEGGVGAVNHLLRPRDMIIPNDYIDFSNRSDVGLDDRYLLVMRDALCPVMRRTLTDVCEERWHARVFDRGVYINTDGRHFESPSEVNHFKIAGADVVGQSICPEVYLAREIGACYAGLYLLVNYAEGIVSPWQHEELADIFYNEGREMARIIFETLRRIPADRDCTCLDLRKETLLKGIY